MPLIDDSNQQISQNKEIHDIIAPRYDASHPEIYNPTEQARIQASLAKAIAMIQSRTTAPLVMDFGAGTGNLTKHLLDLGVQVIATDVSQGSLDRLNEKHTHHSRLQTAILNGQDLAGFGDRTFDMVATYSVLHHVPDYLNIIGEFARVLKPGGIMVIDHEVCPSYWDQPLDYVSYLGELGENFLKTYHIVTDNPFVNRLPFDVKTIRFLRFLYRKAIGISGRFLEITHIYKRRMTGEGDIHTFQHDHIEWDKIITKLTGSCDILCEEDYLVCRETDPNPPVWSQWRSRCSDMRCIVARKRPTGPYSTNAKNNDVNISPQSSRRPQ